MIKPKNQNTFPRLNKINFEVYLFQAHKLAGNLPPGQHVFVIDDLARLLDHYSRDVWKSSRSMKGNSDKWKRDKITEIQQKLLYPVIKSYKEKNKTQ